MSDTGSTLGTKLRRISLDKACRSIGGVGHRLEIGDGYGFRKIREALGVEAFGVNAIVYRAHYEGPEHYHDTQDELYFVHKGRIRVDVGGESRELGEGGLFHAASTEPRRISNAGDEDAIVFVVGGKGGYVERDGQFVNPEVDLPRRQGLG